MTRGSAEIRWMPSQDEFLTYERELLARGGLRAEADAARYSSVPGFCTACEAPTAFRVHTGAQFDGRPNLREGLQCGACGLSSRQRLLHLAVASSIGRAPVRSGALLERHTRLFTALKRFDPGIRGSEFHGARARKGRYHVTVGRGRLPIPRWARHESITDLSYPDDSLGYLAHSDVLEHVEDTAGALEQSRRVVARGSPVIFTAPFFSSLEESVVRGHTDARGNLVELLPSEYHGDGVTGRGIYTFYNFGWSFFTLLKEVFRNVEIGVLYSEEHGLIASDSSRGWWTMLPLVFRCRD